MSKGSISKKEKSHALKKAYGKMRKKKKIQLNNRMKAIVL
jgi:hypothetical protein